MMVWLRGVMYRMYAKKNWYDDTTTKQEWTRIRRVCNFGCVSCNWHYLNLTYLGYQLDGWHNNQTWRFKLFFQTSCLFVYNFVLVCCFCHNSYFNKKICALFWYFSDVNNKFSQLLKIAITQLILSSPSNLLKWRRLKPPLLIEN